MKTRLRGWTVAFGLVGVLLVGGAFATTYINGSLLTSSLGFKIHRAAISGHGGYHTYVSDGNDPIELSVQGGPVGGIKSFTVGSPPKTTQYVLKKMQSWWTTPFGTAYCTNDRVMKPDNAGNKSHVGWAMTAHGDNEWQAYYVWFSFGAVPQTKWDSEVLETNTTGLFCHTPEKSEEIVAVVNFPTFDWGSLAVLSRDITVGGEPSTVVNADGDTVPALDANGRIVWTTPPTAGLRFLSWVTYNGGTSVTYHHRVSNFTDWDKTFSLPEVKTPNFTSGWSGTVSANSDADESYTVTTSTPVWRQRSMFDTADSLDSDIINGRVVRAYTPTTYATFLGTIQIVSAAYDAGTGANKIQFRVMGDSATDAYLLASSGTLQRMAGEMHQVFAPATTYTFYDYGYTSSTVNSYIVNAGEKTNSQVSEVAEITN